MMAFLTKSNVSETHTRLQSYLTQLKLSQHKCLELWKSQAFFSCRGTRRIRMMTVTDILDKRCDSNLCIFKFYAAKMLTLRAK